jgi:polyhydroxybutyrate depolymerase
VEDLPMLPRTATALTMLMLAMPAASPALACGATTPCDVAAGRYFIEAPDGARGAVVFFHGYRGSAAAQMRDADLVRAVTARGLAFVAVDGVGGSWSHVGSPSQDRDEPAFLASVFDDLGTRFGFGPDKIVVSGFSQGASMAWNVVCAQGDRVAAAVTFAGVFWEPLPQAGECVTPPPIIHFHGRGDTVFPLAGRAVGERWRQAPTRASIEVEAGAGACDAAVAVATLAGIACERRACGRGDLLLCIHDGGHQVRAPWMAQALARLGF